MNKAQIKRELESLGYKFTSLLAAPESNPKIKKGLKSIKKERIIKKGTISNLLRQIKILCQLLLKQK